MQQCCSVLSAVGLTLGCVPSSWLLVQLQLQESKWRQELVISHQISDIYTAPHKSNPILDTRISVRSSFVTLRGPPLDSETGWTGELWSNPVLLILEN